MQYVVYRRTEVHILLVSATVLAILEQSFKGVQVVLQVIFLLLLKFVLLRVLVLLGIVHDDVHAIGSLEPFGIDTALVIVASATGVGTGLVECPDVTARKAIASEVGFFKLAHVHAVLAALDLFDKHVHAAVHAVDVQVEMPGTRAVTACLPEHPMGERVSDHALVYIRTMENPVVGRREPEHAHVDAFALLVVDFDGVARLRERGGRLATHLDADVVGCTLGTVGYVVCFSVQHFHGGGNFFGDIHVQTFLLGVNEDSGQIDGLRQSACCKV